MISCDNTSVPSTNTKSTIENSKLKKIFEDNEIKKWYYGFVKESIKFYEDRFTIIKKMGKM